MCLAVPVKIIELRGTGCGVVDSGGVRKEIDLTLVESPAVGEYVLVHAGFAIEKIDEKEARETLLMFQEMMEPGD